MRTDPANERLGDLIRYGTATAVDLSAAKVTVAIDEKLSTGPIPWLSPAAGETRIWSPPAVGEQLIVVMPDGDPVGAFAIRGVFSNDFPAPGDSARELIRFGDGAVLAYDPAAHQLEAVLPNGATVSIVAPGGVTIDADVRITGDLQVDGKVSADGDVTSGEISLQNHRHGDVQSGGSKTGVPE